MTSPADTALQGAASKILELLARLFLKHGSAYGLFEQLAREAFVKAGAAEMRRSNRRPTVSGISALTGLSRKMVKRQLEANPEDESASRLRYNRAVRVLSGWVNDPRFLEDDGPAILAIEGSGLSFSELVREHSGDVTPKALLKVLEEAGNVAVADGRVELLKRAYIPTHTEPDTLNILGADVAELINTVSVNISAGPSDKLFQRKVSTSLLNREELDEFRAFSNQRSQQLLEEYDAWLATRELGTDKEDTAETTYVAVGIYYSEGIDWEIAP